MNCTYFISDLHLGSGHPEVLQHFERFLTGEARGVDALYILGDLFEYWIGDDDTDELSDRVRQSLQLATQNGLTIYFMHGNRDFLLSRNFFTGTGVQRLNDPSIIELYGQKILLMHGDLLCTDDKNYQRYRAWAHNPIVQSIFLLLPLWLRRKIARKLRQKSSHSEKPLEYWDVNEDAVMQTMRQYSCDLLIHGHTHRPNVHHYKNKTRIVLGAWENQGEILRLNEDGTWELIVL